MRISASMLLSHKECKLYLQSLASSAQNRSHVPQLPKFIQVTKDVSMA